MTGIDDIRDAVRTAQVLAFPRPHPAAGAAEAADTASSQTGGIADSAAAGEEASDDGRDGVPPERPDGGNGDDLIFARRPMTDLGNAERFAGRFRDALRYCPALGWLAWDGRRWKRDGAEEKVKLAEHTTARAIQAEAEALAKSEYDFQVGGTEKKPIFLSDKLRGWGRTSEGIQKLAAMSKRAGAMLAIEVDALDRDPMKINVLNGTLHVDRERYADVGYIVLRDHDPGDYITRLAPVAYDPQAEAQLFDAFLDVIQPPTEVEVGGKVEIRRDAQRFLKSWFGYALTGGTAEQKMVFFYGKGRNGKGVLVNIASHIAGTYADSIPIESFLDSGRARAGGQATPDIAGLPGVRLLGTSEPKKGATLDEAFVKLFTGGDRLKARHLNKDYFAFTPCAKLTMQGNYRPKISGADEGIWGRIILVPFSVFIPPEQRDPGLFDKLKGEGSGILNRLLDGLRWWLDHGLVLPDAVAAATAQYRADSDPLGRFLEACTAQDLGGRVQATALYDVFCAWAKANGETVWAMKGFSTGMQERGYASKKSSVSFWLDLKLIKHLHDFPTTSGAERQPRVGDDDRWEPVHD